MAYPYRPRAPRENTASIGAARFTFLTDRFLRMEWSENREFIDGASFAVVNRKMAAVSWKRHEEEGRTVLSTPALRVEYRDNGKPFSKGNLQVEMALPGGNASWSPGARDPENLKGTYRTLDGCNGGVHRVRPGSHWDKARGGRGEPIDLGTGLLSRSGWSFFDDSRSMLQDGGWFAARPASHRQDWYLLAYGRDYTAALRDASRVFGRQPLPPRYALGYWWSRYWAYTDADLEEMVARFDRMDLPLDVLVVDMDWHLAGWTGYTWNRRYFPDPEDFIRRIKRRGIRVTLNLHPADGVGKHEEMFEAMARRLGLDPKRTGRIPFDCTDPEFMSAYFALLHHPKERMGVDFWWMDWQQGTKTAVPDLDPLPWLNILHWEDMEKRAEERGGGEPARPLIFSRYGGLGSGRTPIGFSGDTYSTWESLAYQPYFTATASNALYGYWSHDIGGHMPGRIEPELYTRWIQFGAYSPILRTHTTKNAESERCTWEYPDPHNAVMREALIRRYEMVPYIYTEDRKAMDSGVSLCRPLYYHWPEEEEAYRARRQYMFGDLMMVGPVTAPRDDRTGTAAQELWIPPGRWIDTATGLEYQGPRRLAARYLLEEIPVFVRPGAVIPGQREHRRLSGRSIRDLVVTAWPGADGGYLLYEDDGVSDRYLRGKAAWIRISQEAGRGGRTIEIRLERGGYRGFLARKSLEVRLPASAPPGAVLVAGEEIPWRHRLKEEDGAAAGAAGAWCYHGRRAATIIRLPRIDVRKGVRIRVRAGRNTADGGFTGAAGLPGLLSRLDQVRYYTTLCSSVRPLHPEESLPVGAAQTGNRISRDPASFRGELGELGRSMERLPAVVSGLKRAVKKHMPGDEKRPVYLQKAAAILRQTRGDFEEIIQKLTR